MSISIETLALAKKLSKEYTDQVIEQLPKGLTYKGAVDTLEQLQQVQADVGDVYTVLSDESEYVWGPISNVNQWIYIGPDMSAYQEKLVSGTNIKTINGSTLLGSGDLVVSTNRAFPSGWPTSNSYTTKQFCDIVNADVNAVQGLSYLGEVRWSDLPSTMINGEVIVEIMSGTGSSNKVILLTITSGNLSPYMWKYTYWNNGSSLSGWIGFQPELVSGTNIKTINNTSILGSGDISISSGTQVIANPTLAGTESDLTGLEVDGTKYKVPSDYLPLSGGTMTGDINLTNKKINGGQSSLIGNLISRNSDTTIVGSSGNSGMNTFICRGVNGKAYVAVSETPSTQLKYEILDASNTSANPTLSGGETDLTSLKIAGVDYAIPSGGGAMYAHSISIYSSGSPENNSEINVYFLLLNDTSTPYSTSNDLHTALGTNSYPASGKISSYSSSSWVQNIVCRVSAGSEGTTNYIFVGTFDPINTTSKSTVLSRKLIGVTIVDNVIQLL